MNVSFDQFVRAIHGAALSANEAIIAKNFEILEKYFDSGDSNDDLRDAVDAAQKLGENGDVGQDEIAQTLAALEKAQAAIEVNGEKSGDNAKALRPKTVLLQYPENTADGVVMKNVKVPLISLVPVTTSEITEVKFKTDLEVMTEDGQLMVNFPEKTYSGPYMPDIPATTSSLEITLRPQENSAGLRRIIQGYEKVLRSQMP